MTNFKATIFGLLALLPTVTLITVASIEPIVVDPGNRKLIEVFDNIRLASGILIVATMLIFIGIARSSSAVPNEKRVLWISLLLFANMFALPVFWFFYILKARR